MSSEPTSKSTSEDDGQAHVSKRAKGDWHAAGKYFWVTCWES